MDNDDDYDNYEVTTCPEIEITHDILQWIRLLKTTYEKEKDDVLQEVVRRLTDNKQ